MSSSASVLEDVDLDDHRDIMGVVDTFVQQELIPQEPAYLRDRSRYEDPRGEGHLRLRETARKSGLWGLAAPQEHGGLAAPLSLQGAVATALARSCVPFRFPGYAEPVLLRGSDDQVERYYRRSLEGSSLACVAITESGAGSDVRGIELRATRTASGWRLQGEKAFITFGDDADYAIVLARTAAGRADDCFSAFVVDRSAGWTSQRVDVMGSWHRPAILTFPGVEVGQDSLLGEPGQGLELITQWLVRGRLLVASRCIGIATRCLQDSIAHVRERTTFGKPLASRQGVQWMIAECDVALRAAAALTEQALATASAQPDSAESAHLCSAAKLLATRTVAQVVDTTLQLHGGSGYASALPFEGWYRDVRVLRILEGTDEMQKLIVSRGLLSGAVGVGA